MEGIRGMKLSSVMDYQGSTFHYLPFISRYLWQQEVLGKAWTHLPQRSSTGERERVNGAERKWIVKGNGCWDMLFYCLFHSCMSLLTGLFEGGFSRRHVWVEECRSVHAGFSARGPQLASAPVALAPIRGHPLGLYQLEADLFLSVGAHCSSATTTHVNNNSKRIYL